MKSFKEFLNEDAVKAAEAWRKWMAENPQDFKKGGRFYEKGGTEKISAAAKNFMKTYMKTGRPPEGFEFKTTKVSRSDVGFGGRTKPEPPKAQPRAQQPEPPKAQPRAQQPEPPKAQPRAQQPEPPKAQPRAQQPEPPKAQPRAQQPEPPKAQPRAQQPPNKKPSIFNRVANQFDPSKATTKRGALGRGVNRQLGLLGADLAADKAINQIRDKETRKNVQAVKDFGTSSAALYANPVLGIALGGAGQSSSAPRGRREVGDYTINRKIDPSGGESGMDQYLATGREKFGFGKLTYNDPKAEKIMAWRKPDVSGRPEDKSFRVGAARLGGKIVPVRWGSVAGEKKVGTPQDVAAVQARKRDAASGTTTYGGRQGSAIVGTGGKTTFDTKNNKITTGGKTASLPSTQILPGGRVGDLAYRNGKPVYLARASVASRNNNLFARLSRATGIGGQRQRDAAAAQRERNQAISNTLKYRRDLGISGSGTSYNPPKSGQSARSAQAYAASKGKYYSNTTGKTYANYAAALKDIAARKAASKT